MKALPFGGAFLSYFWQMKILVTGANGFVGNYLVRQLLQNGQLVVATSKGDCRLEFDLKDNFEYVSLDFTDIEQVKKVFKGHRPQMVVHAGAMGRPDECEEKRELAFKINVTGTENLLHAAASLHSHFIFLSTDFVFAGDKLMYKEEDKTGPVNYYGTTKLLAEEQVLQYPFDKTIIRTILVYGKPLTGRNNILTIVKEKLENGETYHVYDDQVRTPTYVEDLCAGIIASIEKRATGIFHIGGKDVLTPFDMAYKVAEYLKLDKSLLRKVTRENFSQPALRPLLTGLDISKARNELGFNPISFEEGLKKTFHC